MWSRRKVTGVRSAARTVDESMMTINRKSLMGITSSLRKVAQRTGLGTERTITRIGYPNMEGVVRL
jgi:hypothetical protein